MSGDRLGWGRLSVGRTFFRLMTLHSAYAELMRRTAYLARARDRIYWAMLSGRPNRRPIWQTNRRGEPGRPILRSSSFRGTTRISPNLSGMLGLSWLLPSYQPDDTRLRAAH